MNLKDLLDIVLKDNGVRKSKGDYAWFCPKCNHHKRKLEIQLEPQEENYQNYHCWICDWKGSSIYSLFKELKVDNVYIEELKKLGLVNKKQKKKDSNQDNVVIELPKEYVFLGDKLNKSAYYSPLTYLKKRKCNTLDIYRYRIGYCMTGPYQDCLIFPSYNTDGRLNYFISKNIYTGEYKNPDYSRNIIFDSMLINWKLPVYICEGIFDYITIKNNGILLLGKNLNEELKLALLQNKPPRVYMVLDGDAIKHSYEIGREISKLGIEVLITKIKDNKDPNDLGHNKIVETINTQSVQLTFKESITEKLSRI